MNALMNIVTLAAIVAHFGLLAYALMQRPVRPATRGWLLATLVLSAGASAVYLLPSDLVLTENASRGLILVGLLALTFTAFGGWALYDAVSHRVRLRTAWIALAVVWAFGTLFAGVLSSALTVGQSGWLADLTSMPDVAGVVAVVGLLLTAILLLVILFAEFYETTLSEMANRTLYWVLTSALLITGLVLMGSGTYALAVAGMVINLLALYSAVTAYSSYTVFDIRGGLGRSVVTLTLVAITASVLFLAFYLVTTLDIDGQPEALLLLSGLALGVAFLFVPARLLIESIVDRLLFPNRFNIGRALRVYTAQVAHVSELKDLANVMAATLQLVLSIRKAGLLLVNSTDSERGTVEFLAIPGGSFDNDMKGVSVSLHNQSPLYKAFAVKHIPVTQFDLALNREYAKVADLERRFFEKLQLNVYVPIILDNVLIGLMAVGSKAGDAAYTEDDLDTLLTIAQQTGFALRNARLVADLRHLNASMRSLNQTLEDANTEMERLDAVKTDFVTIASHELRTPLAQIRGYTDIIDALNEQGMLEKDQTVGLVTNLRKATERMEELIGAMLDVSQLDVNAMDLRFAKTTVESVLRMSIEPISDEIRQRRLSLTVRGTRGLPAVEADLQRLVQAFRNIVGNAIKFTPDGGHIEITASLQPKQNADGVDHILVSVKDTGVGIDPPNLEFVFKKFFRAYDPSLHSTGAYKFLGAGPGLGLTIAKGVIESHGGRIWAESDRHDMDEMPGTTFYVLLPLEPPQGAKRVVTIDTSSQKIELPGGSGTRPVRAPAPVADAQSGSAE